jgi:hypothetical protein
MIVRLVIFEVRKTGFLRPLSPSSVERREAVDYPDARVYWAWLEVDGCHIEFASGEEVDGKILVPDKPSRTS